MSSNRHAGLELSRLLLMFFVAILHTLLQGGILGALSSDTAEYGAAWFLETAAYCAVNGYAILSGYVSAYGKFKWQRLFWFWLEVFFYSVIITGFFQIKFPDEISGDSWLSAFMPITHSSYWYATAYFGMFFFIPLLNLAVEKLPRRQLEFILLGVFVFFCIIPAITSQNPYSLSGGYSMVWLSIMYLLGGYLKKYEIASLFNKRLALLIFAVSTTCAWAFKMGEIGSFVSYTSPFIVINALALICLFANINIKHRAPAAVIRFLSPAAFGVYLIHVHPLVWNHYIKGFSKETAYLPAGALALKVLFLAITLFLACLGIDIIRVWIFKLLKRFAPVRLK